MRHPEQESAAPVRSAIRRTSKIIPEIPFQQQARAKSNRMCGAAALSMVYRSLGIGGTQQEVWERIARADRHGTRAARTHLLAHDALKHGLAALVVQAADPWRTLTRCAAAGVRTILNHRFKADSPLGHYTVLLGVEGDEAVLHDPQLGPRRRLDRAELLQLWRPLARGSEIPGHTLVAFAESKPDPATCPACTTELPPSVPCPGCQKPIALQPAAVLGCIDKHCPERLWQRIFCPDCDRSLTHVPHAAG